ncbi:MAG: transcriptional repressor [Sphingobium sp.]
MGSSLNRPLNMVEEQVLELLASSQHARSAYEIVDQLAERQMRVAPSQIYRALARLSTLGRVRRIESRNAYAFGGEAGLMSLLCHQCRDCRAVDGADLAARMQAGAREAGFKAERLVLEIWGLCARCGKRATAILLFLCSLVPFSGEAFACPYHMQGGPQRFGPFDAVGGWRGGLVNNEGRPFDNGPTATQLPRPARMSDYRQGQNDGTLQEETERGRVE